MKRKLKKYLQTKQTCNYSSLDKLFVSYLSGEIKNLLSKYDDVNIYPRLSNDCNTIQLSYSYNNIHIGIDFFENNYDVVIYHTGISIDEFEKSFIKYNYNECFNLKALIESIDKKIKNHPELKDIPRMKKKRRVCFLIARISFSIPIITFFGIALYVVITKKTLYLGPRYVLVIIIPLCIWFIFYTMGHRLKK